MFWSRYLLAFAAAFAGIANGQVNPPAINSNAAAAYESLLRLRTTATVLHTTAHPDDEDGGLLTWLARGQGVRTGLFTLTRGEGGADLTGPELFDALGLVRTEELLAADRYYAVDQFFSRATDFGFSKRLDETLDHWGKEEILRDAVRVDPFVPARRGGFALPGNASRRARQSSGCRRVDRRSLHRGRRRRALSRAVPRRSTAVAGEETLSHCARRRKADARKTYDKDRHRRLRSATGSLLSPGSSNRIELSAFARLGRTLGGPRSCYFFARARQVGAASGNRS